MSAGEKRAGRRLPLAFSLSGHEEAERREQIGKTFEACLRVDELEDGYEFRFPGSPEWATKLTEFIVFELVSSRGRSHRAAHAGAGGRKGFRRGDGCPPGQIGASSKIPVW